MKIIRSNDQLVQFTHGENTYTMYIRDWLNEKKLYDDMINRWCGRRVFLEILVPTLLDPKEVLILKKDEDGYFEGLEKLV